MRLNVITLISILAIGIGLLLSVDSVKTKADQQNSQWEYTVHVTRTRSGTQVQAELNKFGQDYWELINLQYVLIDDPVIPHAEPAYVATFKRKR